MHDTAQVIQLTEELREGRAGASERLLELLYDDLRALARRHMSRQPPGHTLQPTALVHEAYARLAGNGAQVRGREHFLALAARAMRCVLIDHARGKDRGKRSDGRRRVDLDEALAAGPDTAPDLLALGDALEALER